MERISNSLLEQYINKLYIKEDQHLTSCRLSAPKNKSKMQLSPIEGKILSMLIKLANAKNILEIGTFVGYSTLWIASVLPPNGKIISIEKSVEHYSIAKDNIENSRFKQIIELVNENAIDYLNALTQYATFDAIFIDADKASYPIYLEYAHKLLKPKGLLIADNTFLWGSVYDETIQTDQEMKSAMQAFNKKLADNSKFESIIIPTAEGLSVAIKV